MRPSFARVHALPAVARPFADCVREFDFAAAELFAMDPQIMSVGIGMMPGGHGYRVVRRQARAVRSLRQLDAHTIAVGVRGIAIELHEVEGSVQPLVQVRSGTLELGEPELPEQAPARPLCAGLQVQNWDCDRREGVLAAECVEVGSLGNAALGWRAHADLVEQPCARGAKPRAHRRPHRAAGRRAARRCERRDCSVGSLRGAAHEPDRRAPAGGAT